MSDPREPSPTLWHLPIVRLTGPHAEYSERLADEKMHTDLVRKGGIAYRFGARLSDCLPFRVEDMAASWRRGWRSAHTDEYEREPAKARARCTAECRHGGVQG